MSNIFTTSNLSINGINYQDLRFKEGKITFVTGPSGVGKSTLLPGLMTGQILSGTSPSTAILYQIAIMVAITTSVCLSVFCSLHFGYKALYNKQNQISQL